MFKCATYLYRICKHSLALNCPDSKETENIVHKNMRMGLGVTGYLQAAEDQKSWLPLCYNYLRVYDKQYSHNHGFSISIKLTTCKPSGTLSLLGGCTSGIHPGFSRYYIRRIRISSESKLIELAKKNGYPVEYSKNFDQSIDPNTQIVSFPYSLPEGTVFADECTALQQLEYVKRLQTEWSDNSVSCTVYYRKEELDDIKEDKSKPFLKPESSNFLTVEESNNIASTVYKSCLNKQCLYGLPKDAKFCLKCGTAQLSQFCTECGYSFPGMEKFCPDCGTKR